MTGSDGVFWCNINIPLASILNGPAVKVLHWYWLWLLQFHLTYHLWLRFLPTVGLFHATVTDGSLAASIYLFATVAVRYHNLMVLHFTW
jgi:hypothetical protein